MFSFNHVTISVDNLDKTLEFYKKFGFEKYKEYSDEKDNLIIIEGERKWNSLLFKQGKIRTLYPGNGMEGNVWFFGR